MPSKIRKRQMDGGDEFNKGTMYKYIHTYILLSADTPSFATLDNPAGRESRPNPNSKRSFILTLTQLQNQNVQLSTCFCHLVCTYMVCASACTYMYVHVHTCTYNPLCNYLVTDSFSHTFSSLI